MAKIGGRRRVNASRARRRTFIDANPNLEPPRHESGSIDGPSDGPNEKLMGQVRS
jgi:hypothetical protein